MCFVFLAVIIGKGETMKSSSLCALSKGAHRLGLEKSTHDTDKLLLQVLYYCLVFTLFIH